MYCIYAKSKTNSFANIFQTVTGRGGLAKTK